jgi:hypothetical protein
MPVKRRAFRIIVFLVLAIGLALSLALIAQGRSSAGGDDDEGTRSVRGGGTTIVQGGTGPPSFTPILTKVAFHWRQGAGHFECLALAPTSAPAGRPGSGNFDTNVMYVTGPITSVSKSGHTIVLRGTSTVTGEGAGTNRPFTATYTRGGPGATLVLEVSGLTFREILLEGRFS